MLKVRSPHVLPFALLAALAAACSSSSSGPATETDAGKDTGTQSHDAGTDTNTMKQDTGTVTKDAKTGSDVVTPPPSDASGDAGPVQSPPVVPATAKGLVLNQFVDVIGLTSDDELVYFDSTNGISAVDINGNVSVVAPGTPDAASAPVALGVAEQLVIVLTDYTTKSVMGTPTPVAGTLSIWSKTLGKLQQVATNSTGYLGVAADSSLIIYADNSDPTGAKGNIGVAATTSGATGFDLEKDVTISLTSTTCAPLAEADKGVVVISACQLNDAGVAGKPNITAWAGSGSTWTPTVLATNGGPSNPYNDTNVSVNFTVDSSGTNAITLSGATLELALQGLASTTQNTLVTPYGAPKSGSTSGVEYFYLSKSSAFAIFTQPSGHLGYASITGSTPTVTTPNSTDVVLGVQAVSPDEKWDVDYSTALDSNTGAPSALSLRNIATGASKPLGTGTGLLTSFYGNNTFTADSSYVIFTADLKATGSAGASVGTLYTAPVATGTVNQIVTNQTVWNANPLANTDIVYSQNYLQSMLPNLHGGATADIYVVKASGTTQGTKVVTGADAPDYFYITADKSHIFFTLSNVLGVDATTMAATPYATDGLYSIALPATP